MGRFLTTLKCQELNTKEAVSHKAGIDPPGGCYPEATPSAISAMGCPPHQSKGEGAGQEAAVGKPLYFVLWVLIHCH